MKLFGIFNLGGTPSAPAESTTAPAVSLLDGGSLGYRVGGEPPQELSKFEETYSRPPYLDGSFRAGVFYGQPPGSVSPKTIEEIAQRIGSIIPPADKAELAEIFASDTALNERMAGLGFYSSTQKWQLAKQQAEAKIRAGETGVLIPTREQIVANISMEREVVHELLRQNAARTYRILKAACERFERAAREFFLEEDRQEKSIWRERHDDAPYVPPLFIRELAYVALAVAYAPVRNYELCRHLRAPDPTTPLIDVWIKAVPAFAPAQSQPAATMRPNEILQRQRESADAETRAAEHKKNLDEKNALTEKIKSDIQKTAEETELAKVRASMDADARTAAVKKKILDEAAAKTAETGQSA